MDQSMRTHGKMKKRRNEKKKIKDVLKKVVPKSSNVESTLISQVKVVKLKKKKKAKNKSETLAKWPDNLVHRSDLKNLQLLLPNSSSIKKNGSKSEDNAYSDDNTPYVLKDESVCPLVIEVDSGTRLQSLKISGSSFKTPPSNIAFGFKPSSFMSYSANACNYENCQITYGNVEASKLVRENNVTKELLVPESWEDLADNVDELSSGDNDMSLCHVSPHQNYKYLKVDEDKMVVALVHPYSLYFNGALSLKVLIGTVEVLGYEIHDDCNTHNVFSPAGSSLLCISSKFLEKKDNWKGRVKEKLLPLQVPSEFYEDLFVTHSSVDCLVLLEKMASTLPFFLNKYINKQLFPMPDVDINKNSPEAYLNCEIAIGKTLKKFKTYKLQKEWDTLANTLLSKNLLKVMMCGGKAVGKSTSLRFLINKTLNKSKQVLYLDFDPGQGEFTVPGCVSAVLVKTALLGPNFTHLMKPQRMIFVGNVNVAQCSEHYLKCCEDIIQYCCSRQEFASIPWFINTMGFTKGIGVDIMVYLIKLVRPTNVVQIESVNKKRNYPELLTPSYIAGYQTTIFRYLRSNEDQLNYNFIPINSAAERSAGETGPWGMEPRTQRELVTLAYFNPLVSRPAYSLLGATPFTIPFAGLKLCVCHERISFSHYLTAINGNLVALCKVENSTTLISSDPKLPQILETAPICHYVGFGIVRGVDMDKQLVFITSPIPEAERKIVDCLVLGAVHLPSIIYTTTERPVCNVPYVSKGQLMLLGSKLGQSSSRVIIQQQALAKRLL